MTDAQLIQAARDGDRAAFGTLVARHHARVVAQCVRLAGNRADGEDLAHDAWVEAWLKLGQLADPAAFAGWLRTVTLNVFRMWYRRRRETVALPEGLPAAAPEHRREVLHRRLDQGLSALTRTHRVVLVLHYLEGLSYAEIAALLDLAPGTVMSRLHRGRRALGALLMMEEMPMVPSDGPAEDVLAEIAVLLELHAEQPGDPARLSVILEKSPERLRGLLEATTDPALLAAVGALLPRLGGAGWQVVVDAALGAGRGAEGAAEALQAAAGRLKTLSWGGGADDSPGPEVYHLAAALLDHPAPAPQKVALLMALLPAVADAASRDLLTDLLLSWGAAAQEALLARYRGLADVAGFTADRSLLTATCRLGAPFADTLVGELAEGAAARVPLALAGVESLARLRGAPEADGDPRARALAARHVRALAPDLSPEAWQGLADGAAAYVDAEATEVRQAALRCLGALGQGEAPVLEALHHPEAATRAAALRACAAMRHAGATERLAELARTGLPEERRLAVEALGAAGAQAAEPLLAALVDEAGTLDLQVAAVTALGELGTDSAAATLRAALETGPVARRKAVAKALYRGQKRGRPPMSRRLWSRLRGDAEPIAEISVEAALRWGLAAAEPLSEADLSRALGEVCMDVSSVRRKAVQEGYLERDAGIYAFTPLGVSAWRVEQAIRGALG